MDTDPTAHVGECLAEHAEAAARRAHGKLGGPLAQDNLSEFLIDEDCLRYPTEIRFDEAGLTSNQFAEPFFEERDGAKHCVLHVDPRWTLRAETWPYFVAYMAGVINYGRIVTPDFCEQYGAALVGLDREAYYQKLCDLVDSKA